MTFYAARQPILNREKELTGYELLFRDGVDNAFPTVSGDEATSRLIEGSQFAFGLEELTNNQPAHINFTLETLAKGYATMMSPEQVVVEIIEDQQPGKRLLALVKDLKEKGYTIALDNYVHQNVWRHFYPFVDLIKVNFLTTSLEQITQIKAELVKHPQIKLVAEKVESHEQFQQALELGFSYFQGFFFSKPEMVQSKALPPSELTLAELLYETSTSDMDLAKITQIFERDVNLSYKLLRYSNSAMFKRRAEVATIKQALVVLGANEIKKLLSLLFAAQVSGDKPTELMRMSLTRARFAELLAESEGNKDSGKAFLTGMMSLLDAILNQTMSEVIERLPLTNDIKAALSGEQGKLDDYMTLIRYYEKADWQGANEVLEKLQLDSSQVPDLYHEAINWANEQMSVIM